MQSLCTKVPEINALFPKFSIICISEHWFQSAESITSVILDNYKLVNFFCRSSTTHGGVAIFVNSSYFKYFASRDDILALTVENHVELSAIESKVLNLLVVIYRPPKGDMNIF